MGGRGGGATFQNELILGSFRRLGLALDCYVSFIVYCSFELALSLSDGTYLLR